MRREALLMVAIATSLLAAGCSRLERLSLVRPSAERGEYTQVAPTYDVSGRKAGAGAHSGALVRAAIDRLQRGQVEEAGRLAQQALKADSRSADAHSILGSVAEVRGEASSAGKHYKAAARLAPGSGIHANNLGVWLCAQGQAPESMPWFDQALADPAYPTPAAALANAGSCAHKAGMSAQAEAHWRRLLSTDPVSLPALAGMAQLKFEQGSALEARAFAERWLAVAPADAAGLRLAAAIETKLGDNAAASRYLSRLQGIPSASTTSPPAR